MSQSGKLMPNLDQQSTKVLNLTVLQRIDPFVEEILMTAAHVTFYEFNIELNQWSRKDVEGSLFVVKRNTQPRFQFIVMNRRNTGHENYVMDHRKVCELIPNLCVAVTTSHALTLDFCADNLVEDLLGDFEYEVQVPYLLYRNAAQEVNGIWFYNAHDCEAIANLFGRILNAYSKVPPKPKASSKSSEFEELEAVPTSAVVEGPLEPPPTSSAAATVPDVPDESFVNFFSAATNIGNVSKSTITGQPHQSSAAIPLSSPAPNVIPTTVPTLHSALSPPTSAPPLKSFLDVHESSSKTSRATNLVKPSFFAAASSSSSLMMPPVASSMPASPPLHPPVTMQRPYGTPLLQPFPPPTPPPSLTPTPNYGSVITRDRVRDALLKLVQNDQFIDMVYREMLNAHYS